jgi:hypothetical protein
MKSRDQTAEGTMMTKFLEVDIEEMFGIELDRTPPAPVAQEYDEDTYRRRKLEQWQLMQLRNGFRTTWAADCYEKCFGVKP